MRTTLFICLAALVAAASQAQTGGPTPAAVSATATAATPAPPAPAAEAANEAPRPYKPPPGWKARRVKGELVYCRSQTKTGTRFSDDVCMTQEALKQWHAENEDAVKRMEQALRTCGGGACTPP